MTKNTQGFIDSLEPNETIVVGTNLWGNHAGGAAAQAHKDFGLRWGIGVGPSGNSYAIPTMEIDLENIALYIKQFIDYATITPEKTYYVTEVGCGIANFNISDIAGYFKKAPTNVVLPISFVDYINRV